MALPPGYENANLTSIAFAGSQAIVAAGGGLLVNDGGAWHVDASAQALLDRVRAGNPYLYAVAGLPDGGAVAAGRDIVIERDGAQLAVAVLDPAAAGLDRDRSRGGADGRRVRAIVSVVPRLGYPPADDLPEPDPNVPPPILPPFTCSGRRLSAARDRDRMGGRAADRICRDRRRRPEKSDPVLAPAARSIRERLGGRRLERRRRLGRPRDLRAKRRRPARQGTGADGGDLPLGRRRHPAGAAATAQRGPDAGRPDPTRCRRQRRVRLVLRRPGAAGARARPDAGGGAAARRRNARRSAALGPSSTPATGSGPASGPPTRRATPNSSAASRACRSIRRWGPTTSPVAKGSPPSSRPSPHSRRRWAAAPRRVASRPPGSPARLLPAAPAPTTPSTASARRAPCGSS